MFYARKHDDFHHIIKAINKNNYLKLLPHLYNYVKRVTEEYCLSSGGMHSSYYYLLKCLIEAEKRCESCNKNQLLLNLEYQDRSFLDYLVYHVRRRLIANDVSDASFDFTNKCVKASLLVRDFCENNSDCYLLRIYPGYDSQAALFDGSGLHYANIIKYGGSYYLVDVTYSQFFNKVKENLASMGIVDFKGCDVGTFARMDERRKKVADEILQFGYIKLTEEIFKSYLDSFTISFRNGLYYEEYNDFSYTTDYTIDDYVKFLGGYDSQVLHEGREFLGYQKKPLKDYSLDFRKRG